MDTNVIGCILSFDRSTGLALPFCSQHDGQLLPFEASELGYFKAVANVMGIRTEGEADLLKFKQGLIAGPLVIVDRLKLLRVERSGVQQKDCHVYELHPRKPCIEIESNSLVYLAII